MPIITIQNKDNLEILHNKSTIITEHELPQYIEVFKEMKSLLKPKNYGSDNHNGLGLALPQMGINKRGFVFRKGDHYEIVINPKILNYGNRGKKMYDEACLSIPILLGLMTELGQEDFCMSQNHSGILNKLRR